MLTGVLSTCPWSSSKHIQCNNFNGNETSVRVSLTVLPVIQSSRFSPCLAREQISDCEISHLAEKYHRRHPTFSLDVQERTCKSIVLVCVFHYRHVEIDLKCQCRFNDVLHKFEKHWSTHHSQYSAVLNKILSALDASSIYRSLTDQIETIIAQLTTYCMQLKPIPEEGGQQRTRSTATSSDASIPIPFEFAHYNQSLEHPRQVLLRRSFSWSQPLASRPNRSFNSISMLGDTKKKT